MPKQNDIIVSEILNHVALVGDLYSDWYIGIAEDPHDRLFNGHGVSKELDAWIIRESFSSEDARLIEAHFLNRIGMRGGPGGGSGLTKWVYAYKITRITRQ